MPAKIVNVFSNVPLNRETLKGGHGQSFLISIGEENILYDTGSDGNILLKNMEALSISPDDITRLVISHGHTDHTGGLPALLEKRRWNTTLTLVAHPAFREQRIYKVLKLFGLSGCHNLPAGDGLQNRAQTTITVFPNKIMHRINR